MHFILLKHFALYLTQKKTLQTVFYKYFMFTFSLPLELLACTSPTNFKAFADCGIAFIASLEAYKASFILERAK